MANNGERMTFEHSSAATIQAHLCRYVWALKHCVGKTVLDAGCGIGYGTALLAEAAQSVVGIDPSPDAVNSRWAGSGIHDLSFYQDTIENFTWNWYDGTGRISTAHFDTVVCLEVLEHLEDMEAGLAKLLDLTAPGGKLLISVPVHQGLNQFHHGRDYSVAAWDVFMQNRGLNITYFYQAFGGDGDECPNCDIRYRITSTQADSGYSLYLIRKAVQ